ncbi:heme oxygenase [Colletotrichum truncatum]|uniref:Heme oxygenase n=1 Tax=Colletotrichum truncatum TaxID=5467 RepID=A0ACC3ZIV0_COLTU|nr:heme oxygenase [Colletotrichum truncatum]KAF6791848.1 heme oxygenase [Colletotrichum truncatum]
MTSTVASPAEHVKRPLSESIAAATRSVHAKLNKLIIARLPLAIPPRSNDPSIYVSGLLHIAPIYIAFESLWKDIVESSSFTPDATQGDGCEPGFTLFDSNGLSLGSNTGHGSKYQAVCERTHSILKLLYLPKLMRSDRLRSDISTLTGWSPEVIDKQLEAVSEAGRLAEFTSHVRRTIEKKPHVLLAYSYILYMALFAGGRFIRATLESVGSEFWEHAPSSIPPFQTSCSVRTLRNERFDAVTNDSADIFEVEGGMPKLVGNHLGHTLPLRFFHFATVLDGEDLKREFKKRLTESEGLLTTQERQDVIQEAICIFDNMLLLVGQLDNVCKTNFDDDHSAVASWASKWSLSRPRDSVIVTHERRDKSSMKGAVDSDESDRRLYTHARLREVDNGKGSSPIYLEGQPPVCCPASKSMRFEAKLPVSDRKDRSRTLPTDGAANVPSSTRSPAYWLSSRPTMVLVFNISLVAGLAVFVSLHVLSRGSVDGELTVEEW